MQDVCLVLVLKAKTFSICTCAELYSILHMQDTITNDDMVGLKQDLAVVPVSITTALLLPQRSTSHQYHGAVSHILDHVGVSNLGEAFSLLWHN